MITKPTILLSLILLILGNNVKANTPINQEVTKVIELCDEIIKEYQQKVEDKESIIAKKDSVETLLLDDIRLLGEEINQEKLKNKMQDDYIESYIKETNKIIRLEKLKRIRTVVLSTTISFAGGTAFTIAYIKKN